MKIVFLSNYYNHHQSAFSEAMFSHKNIDYHFIATEPMEQERINMGWGNTNKPPFVLYSYEPDEKGKCSELISKADVVIYGNAPYKMIESRLKNGKLTFAYSERWYKKGFSFWKLPYRLFHHQFMYGKYNNLYMLCASAFTAYDCSRTGLYKNKTYKWGYFPAVKHYDDIDELIELKHPASILWVARLIEWKHPEIPLLTAQKLKAEGYAFTLNLIGNGELEETLKSQIREYGLEDCVHLLGSMKPEQVREHMEQSEIFLFTSDFNEGWGAVLNESMNSACAVVASHAIGSVPFLLMNGKNGMVYENGNTDSCYQKVKYLLDHPKERKEFGKSAYYALRDTWNAEIAAERLVKLSQAIMNGEKHPDLFADGPCSKADIIKNNWYHEGRNS